MSQLILWAIEWRGKERHLQHQWDDSGRHLLFKMRRACRELIESRYGYIKRRPDLRQEPHCWRMPRAIKVQIVKVRKP